MHVKTNRTAVFAIAIVLILAGILVYRERNKTGAIDKNAEVNAQKLVEDYKIGLKDIWAKYQTVEPNPKKEVILNLRDTVLGLTVPSKLKQAHLDFTIGLSLLAEGLKDENKVLIEKGRKRIEKFKQDNTWLISN